MNIAAFYGCSAGLTIHIFTLDDNRLTAEVFSCQLIIVRWRESSYYPLTKAEKVMDIDRWKLQFSGCWWGLEPWLELEERRCFVASQRLSVRQAMIGSGIEKEAIYSLLKTDRPP